MSGAMFSPSWYRVAGLQPRLRSHAEIHRHYYRGQLWYVLQDRLSGRNHRFTPAAHYLISLMNGQRTCQKIWELALDYLGDEAPGQEDMIRLIGQLHAIDLLLCDVPPDTLELFTRHRRQAQGRWRQRWLNPLSLRFPLWDPNDFLERWRGPAAWLFSRTGFGLWLLVVGTALILGLSHWEDLTRNLTDQVLAPSNLVIMLLVFPVVKLLHELGHAFSAKVWGAEVHELGVMLLVLMPVPYVEASGAAVFRDKRRRMVVGAAGMLVEMFLASLALFVWLNAEPGWLRAVCYNIIFIGSVSTLVFNLNPLLRFDGYFIFSDAVEIPNLAQRANQYLGYWVQRRVFGEERIKSPAQTPGEAFWLATYGVGAFVYRAFVAIAIILFIAGKFFFIGVALALWGAATMLLLPLVKGLRFVLTNPVIQRRRLRAVAISAGTLAVLLLLLFAVPVPLYTRAEGVAWPPEKALVRAGADGFVRQLRTAPDTPVTEGTPLLETADPELAAHRDILSFRLKALEAEYNAAWLEDVPKAQQIREEMAAVRASLAKVEEDLGRLVVRSPADGTLVLPRAEDLQDKWLKQGDLVGYVVQRPIATVRVVVAQDDIGLVRQRVKAVTIRPSEAVATEWPAVIQREVPAASNELPSAALSQEGGGQIAVDPAERRGNKAFETVFQFDLRIVYPAGLENIGSRVYVRFDHGSEPLARQWYRKLRQLFLRRYSV